MRALIYLIAILCLPALAQAVPLDLNWASQLDASSGALTPENALGAPDGLSAGLWGPTSPTATYSGFGDGDITSTDSVSLSSLLGVSEGTLAAGNLITFEHNGSSGIGFEGATWTFSDGVTSIVVPVPFGNNGASSEIVAFGSISNNAFASFFGFSNPYSGGDNPFLIFDLSGLNLDTLQITAAGGGLTSPDPDAFAAITQPAPEPPILGLVLIGFILLLRQRQ